MPGGMPTAIAKGATFKKIDEWVNKKIPDQAIKALTVLDDEIGFPTMMDVITELQIPFTQAELDHLRDDWFDVDSGWWRDLQPIARPLRCGLREAMKRVRDEQVPIDCYWVCTADMFEVWVTLSAQQVNLLIATPLPPATVPANTLTKLEDIWVARGASHPGEQPQGADCIVVRPMYAP